MSLKRPGRMPNGVAPLEQPSWTRSTALSMMVCNTAKKRISLDKDEFFHRPRRGLRERPHKHEIDLSQEQR